jgi:hypothetical protein
MIGLAITTVVVIVVAVWVAGWLTPRQPRPARGGRVGGMRQDAQVKRWVDVKFGWSVASHAGGRYIHLLPEGDGQVHTEDAAGDCTCAPQVNRFERTRAGDGWLIIHHTTPAGTRQ